MKESGIDDATGWQLNSVASVDSPVNGNRPEFRAISALDPVEIMKGSDSSTDNRVAYDTEVKVDPFAICIEESETIEDNETQSMIAYFYYRPQAADQDKTGPTSDDVDTVVPSVKTAGHCNFENEIFARKHNHWQDFTPSIAIESQVIPLLPNCHIILHIKYVNIP